MLCFASLLCIAEERAEMPNLRDPEVLKKIISEAVELESFNKADGSIQFSKINELTPFNGMVGELHIGRKENRQFISIKEW